MWRNYLITAIRALRRNKQFSLLNILGLAVGLAACLLMTAYVIHELSFDRMHVKGERIFRINGNVAFSGEMLHNAVVAAPLGPAVKDMIPEIEASVRLLRHFDLPVRAEGRDFKEKSLFAAEPQFLDIFTIPLRQGDPRTALSEPFTAVIDETLGRKYFGDRDPVGRTLQIRLGQTQEIRVTGVMKDIPSNSVLKRPMILSYATIERVFGDRTTKWEAWGSTTTFVLLRPGADSGAVQKKITAAVLPHLGADEQKTFYDLQPLRRIYLDNAAKGMNNDLDYSGSRSRIAVFSAIALLIMIVAAINFINLSTAKVARRMKEVGVRKTCGAGRGSLIRQFLFESMILTAISMFLGLGFFELFKPRLETFLGKSLSLGVLQTPGMIAVIGAVTVVVGFLAGSYPAFYLSRFPASAMFRPGSGTGASKAGLRRALVVAQFIIAIALTAATLIVLKQVRFAETKDLGFDRSQLSLSHLAEYAVAVVIRIAGERHVETVAQPDQPRHGVRRGAIHADLPVPVHGHETERRIDLLVDDRQAQPVALRDARPVRHSRAAERIHTERKVRRAHGLHVDHPPQVAHVGGNVVVPVRGGCGQRPLVRHTRHLAGVSEQRVRFRLNPARGGGVRWSAVRRVVLDSAVVRRVMGRREHDAVRQSGPAPAIVRQDGVRKRRRGRVAQIHVHHHLDAVGRQHLQRTGEGRLGERVCILCEVQRPFRALEFAIAANRLRNGEDVRFVKRAGQR